MGTFLAIVGFIAIVYWIFKGAIDRADPLQDPYKASGGLERRLMREFKKQEKVRIKRNTDLKFYEQRREDLQREYNQATKLPGDPFEAARIENQFEENARKNY